MPTNAAMLVHCTPRESCWIVDAKQVTQRIVNPDAQAGHTDMLAGRHSQWRPLAMDAMVRHEAKEPGLVFLNSIVSPQMSRSARRAAGWRRVGKGPTQIEKAMRKIAPCARSRLEHPMK